MPPLKKHIIRLDDNVMKVLMNYHWPGNIRELEHTIERAFILCHGQTILLEHLPPEILKSDKEQDNKSEKKAPKDSYELSVILQKPTGIYPRPPAGWGSVAQPSIGSCPDIIYALLSLKCSLDQNCIATKVSTRHFPNDLLRKTKNYNFMFY